MIKNSWSPKVESANFADHSKAFPLSEFFVRTLVNSIVPFCFVIAPITFLFRCLRKSVLRDCDSRVTSFVFCSLLIYDRIRLHRNSSGYALSSTRLISEESSRHSIASAQLSMSNAPLNEHFELTQTVSRADHIKIKTLQGHH